MAGGYGYGTAPGGFVPDRRATEGTMGRRLVAYLREVPPEELRGDSRFRRRLRLDTYGHYPIHAADIRAWREQRDARG